MQFRLIFDGKALDNPKQLSVALVAIDNLLQEANQVINNKDFNLEVKVKGSFESGSFAINSQYLN